jgi:HK97 family phage major capsid protein
MKSFLTNLSFERKLQLAIAVMIALVMFIAVTQFGWNPMATPESGLALLLGETALAADLKKMEAAMESAFTAMRDGIKRQQDTVNNALEESRKEGGRLHAETSKKIEDLSKSNQEVGEKFGELRSQVIELSQKLGTKPQGSGAGSESLQDIIVNSAEWKAASGKPNAKQMDAVHVGNVHRFMNTQIVNAPLTNDQPLVQPHRVAGIVTPAEQRLYIRDLLPQAPIDTNLIEFASESAFTNNARPQGDASPGGVEGEAFAESALTFTLSNAAVVTIGHWIPASRQVLSDAKMLMGHIQTRLLYGLKLEEEEEILTGNGTAGTLNGICNQAAAYNRGVTNDTVLDTLLKALLQVSLSNYEASGFVMHPVDWYNAMLLKDTQGRYLFSNPQDMVAPRVWSKPVVASQTMTQGKFLAGAFSLGAQLWDRQDATIRISENVDDHFIRNMVAILVEERLALTVYRSTAFVYGNTSHAG